VSHARLTFIPSSPSARWLAVSCLMLSGAAVAQGAPPPAAGEKPFGGFEPVLHLRTYYLDQESLTGVPASAWAFGGWAGLRSPWWGDMFRVGIVGYTSLKLIGPDDEDGTKLLAPGQEAIAVLGEAFGSLRMFGQTFTGYRQRINRPFINIQDSRMVPNTFEAYTLTGAASGVSYTGGYITKMKKREAEHFVWMSDAAGGGNSDHKGTAFAGATWDFVKDGYVRADFQQTYDVFNTVYVDGKYPIALDQQTVLALGAQYYHQKSVGSAQIGDFSTWGAGVQATITRGPFGGQLYYTQTGKGFETQAPYGDHPSYLYLMQVAFNSAGEEAWGIGGNINFASLGAPGLTAAAVYASGKNRINATTGASIPNRDETNIRADYAFPKGTALEGLVATFRYSWLHQDGSPQTAPQLRAYLNYDVRF